MEVSIEIQLLELQFEPWELLLQKKRRKIKQRSEEFVEAGKQEIYSLAQRLSIKAVYMLI